MAAYHKTIANIRNEINLTPCLNANKEISGAIEIFETALNKYKDGFITNASTTDINRPSLNRLRLFFLFINCINNFQYLSGLNSFLTEFTKRCLTLQKQNTFKLILNFTYPIYGYTEYNEYLRSIAPHSFATIKVGNFIMIADSIRGKNAGFELIPLHQLKRLSFIQLTHLQAGTNECKEMSQASLKLFNIIRKNQNLISLAGKQFNNLSYEEQILALLTIQALFTQSRKRILEPKYCILIPGQESIEESLPFQKITIYNSPHWPQGFLPGNKDSYSYNEVAKYSFKQSEEAFLTFSKNAEKCAQKIIDKFILNKNFEKYVNVKFKTPLNADDILIDLLKHLFDQNKTSLKNYYINKLQNQFDSSERSTKENYTDKILVYGELFNQFYVLPGQKLLQNNKWHTFTDVFNRFQEYIRMNKNYELFC